MKNIFPYLYDYFSLLFENKEIKNHIKKVILFGSAATGEFDSDSDLDIFIEVPKIKVKLVENIISETEKRFYASFGKKWSLTNVNIPIKCIVGDMEEPRWAELKSEMIGNGIMLYGKFETLPKNLKHYSLFTYSLANLSQKEKMKFLRKLFGYKSIKGGKEYIQQGLLKEIGGKKITANSLLIPLEKSREIQKFFTSSKVTPEIREIWLRNE